SDVYSSELGVERAAGATPVPGGVSEWADERVGGRRRGGLGERSGRADDAEAERVRGERAVRLGGRVEVGPRERRERGRAAGPGYARVGERLLPLQPTRVPVDPPGLAHGGA